MRAFRTAEIIAVGSEMLTPVRVDTNSLFITERLNDIGIAVRVKVVVGDVREDLCSIVEQALVRADVIILSGGLGPTDDDLTREVVAEVLKRPLEEHGDLVDALRARFASRGLDMPEINRRQAMVPAGAEILPNPRGTAPGLYLEHDGRAVALLPGPPRELKPMFDTLVRERLAARSAGAPLLRGIVRVTGMGESHAEQIAQPLYARWREEQRPVEATTLAAPGSIDFRITVPAAGVRDAAGVLARTVADLREAFGDSAYTSDERGLEEVVGEMLVERGLTIAAGESCTGGLFTSRLTDVPGSSRYVIESVVAYSNEAKTRRLGVDAAIIAAHGAVSEPVALAMAHGARSLAGASVGVGITGIAGPEGGTPAKPVGTVVIAVEGPWGASVRTRQLVGGREMVKFFSTQGALDDVRRALLAWRG